MLEHAIAEWKRTAETVPIPKHPVIWVGHYSEGRMLASVYAPRCDDPAEMVLILAAPFAVTTDVDETMVIHDRSGTLVVSHMAVHGGVYTTTWTVPYSRADDGTLSFSVGYKRPLGGRMGAAIDTTAEHRLLGNPLPGAFWEAYRLAALEGKALL